jgi:hypothetical protein
LTKELSTERERDDFYPHGHVSANHVTTPFPTTVHSGAFWSAPIFKRFYLDYYLNI